ncbi:DUF3418 domain-containing protein [Micromonospora sp. NPDC005173]|uniref:DUF3418 domain-containing protein n=1 Tax=Micromonospora sp. NPDC005173 TaxID=3157165 RepID=UPI00339F242E
MARRRSGWCHRSSRISVGLIGPTWRLDRSATRSTSGRRRAAPRAGHDHRRRSRTDGPHRRPPGGAPPPARRAPDGRPPGQHLGQARRMLEKYRVQLWAQQLGTAQTVSDARIRKMLSP